MKISKTPLLASVVVLGMASHASAVVLFEDDFTGRTSGVTMNNTAVQSGTLLPKTYESANDTNAFVYDNGFITTAIPSGTAGRNVAVPLTVADMPAGQDILVFETVADPLAVDFSFFGFSAITGGGGMGNQGDLWFDIRYDGSDVDYRIRFNNGSFQTVAGSEGTLVSGGSTSYRIEYDTQSNTILSASVGSLEIVSNHSLGAFTPNIQSIRWVSSGATTTTNGAELFGPYSVEAIPEPSAMAALMGVLGLAFVGFRRYRNR